MRFTRIGLLYSSLIGLGCHFASCACPLTRGGGDGIQADASAAPSNRSGAGKIPPHAEIFLEWEVLDGEGQPLESAEWAIFDLRGDLILEGQGARGSTSVGQGRFTLQAMSIRTGDVAQEVVELGPAIGNVKRVRLRVDESP